MKISKKFKKLSLVTLLLSSVLFALNINNVFGMAEPIKKDNPATALMPPSRLDYLIAQIKSNQRFQQLLEIIGNLREQFLITALKESCFRYHQAENILNPAYTSSEGSFRRKQTTQKTIEALQRAEDAYFDASPLVQELVDQIELAAQIHHVKEISGLIQDIQSKWGYQDLKGHFTYTVIKDIVSKEMLSKEDHLKYLFSQDYFTKFKLIDVCIPFTLSISYFRFLNKSYNSILGKTSTFTLEVLYEKNPELLNQILAIFKKIRGYNLKLITLEKIDQFLLTQKSFGNTQQEKCLRRLHENKKLKLNEMKTKIAQDTYSLQELEDQTNITLEGLPENLRTKVLFLIQCELENQSGELLDKYFDYLMALTNIQLSDCLPLAKQIDIEDLSTLDIEKTLLNSWLKEILKPELKIEEITEPQDHKKTSHQKRGKKVTGKKTGKKPVKKSGANKSKPIDIQKGSPEVKPVIVVDKQSPDQTIPQALLADGDLAQITQQISELTFEPQQQVDPSARDDYTHRNCIYDLSRGIFNGHQIKLLVFNGLQDAETLLQNLDYSFLEQHGKILRTLDNNHSFSKLIERNFGSLGTIIESQELAKDEMQHMTTKYGRSFNFEQYKYKITVHIPGRITGLSCSTDFANGLRPNGNFEFVILQRNPADHNPLCVHRFFRPLNYVGQTALA